MNPHHYYVYITTNPAKTVLYIGMTNDLVRRMDEHRQNRGKSETFAGKYFCFNLVYWEHHQYVNKAIDREKELKGWTRVRKNTLIAEENPNWLFLNAAIQPD